MKINDDFVVTGMSTTPNLRVNTLVSHSTTQVNVNDNLTVSGALLVGTTNVMTEIGSKVKPADLAWFAPKASAVFSGETTIPELRTNNIYAHTDTEVKINDNLTVSGNLKVGVGVSSDAPTGLVLGGSQVTTLGNLWVNGNLQSTGNLTIDGTITGYAKQTDMDLKAPKASPALTGTATADNLTVAGSFRVNGNSTIFDKGLTVGVGLPATENALSVLGNSLLTGNLQVNASITCDGSLTVASTNVLTALGEKATTTALNLKAPKESPAFTGTATAAALTVSGALLV